MINRRYLQHEIDVLEKDISIGQKRFESLPEGDICSCNLRNGTSWRIKRGNSYVYLPKKQSELAGGLAERRFLKPRLDILRRRQRCLNQLMRLGRDEEALEKRMLGKKSPYKELLEVRYQCVEDRLEQFRSYQSNQNKSYPEGLRFRARSGNVVRSKVEVIVDDLLLSMDLRYYYEPEVVIGGNVYYPDFVIIDELSGKDILIEIFGMMDDPRYSSRAVEKINTYGRNGYYVGINFIPFFETLESQLNPDYIGKMIEKVLRNL